MQEVMNTFHTKIQPQLDAAVERCRNAAPRRAMVWFVEVGKYVVFCS